MTDVPPKKTARLLIADDEEGLLYLMADGLRREGYEVESFDSGEEAHRWLARERADLLVLDLKLTDLPALSLIEQLRKEGRECPFIIVTGHGDERTAVNAMKEGALDYVMKDAGMLELLPSIVRRALAVVERERKLSEANETIRLRDERLQHVIQTALDGFLRFERNGRLLEINEALSETLGYSMNEMLGRSIFDSEAVAFPREVKEHVATLEVGGTCKCFTQLQRRDGAPIEVEVSMRDDQGEIFAFVHDVSEQRRLERKVLEIAFDERRQFGRELHDGLGQQLTALELMTHTLARELKVVAPKQAKTAWEITKYMRRAVTQTRELAHGLSPVAGDGEGLMQALQELAEMAKTAGTPCEFECPQPVKIKDETIVGNLYRIAQEAIANSLKHAAPKRITLRLLNEGPDIHLAVEDCGRGLPRGKSAKPGMGMQVMQHRARVIGAQLQIHSAPGKGVKVICSLRKPS
ncbi:multi-sensor signal transduction histidine kinase [Chthoniobacter flavus Ellin428]|uniref:histidine kinase n=1 Tax=Chthoniobacter flavus Ellin428 TaxID=497964 RepID=B4D2V7_9BACT|nr:response regulator [Chthoniobacter flavus]EDY19068.1 multi-sensor signal transduction histidine kinase [Chthoniobacter flavus Ellin428]TCO86831.1 PAS domain S-box-containing protein [Chthoniobacter flavus]